VHPTQLYEAALGLLAGALSAIPLARGRRDGSAFTVFLTTYAVGRFAIELLRGDQDRGHALSLSTAQWVSLVVLAALAVAWAWRAYGPGRTRSPVPCPHEGRATVSASG
jgi:prolipoprotein diacylglyceryltransferase